MLNALAIAPIAEDEVSLVLSGLVGLLIPNSSPPGNLSGPMIAVPPPGSRTFDNDWNSIVKKYSVLNARFYLPELADDIAIWQNQLQAFDGLLRHVAFINIQLFKRTDFPKVSEAGIRDLCSN